MSLEEVFRRIAALREDLDQLDVDVDVTVTVDIEGCPELPYAEFAERLRKALEEAEG